MQVLMKKCLFLILSFSLIVSSQLFAQGNGGCAPCGECYGDTLKQCSYPLYTQPTGPTLKKKCTHHRKKHKIHKKAVSRVIPIATGCGIGCKEPIRKITPCEPVTVNVIHCPLVNPADIVDSTCREFIVKLRKCEPYICQAPYVLNPSIKTKWEIHGRVGNRCIISNTTEDMGIKNDDGKAIPITQTCEYDSIGMTALIKRFVDMDKEYFHFSTCEYNRGIHNCTFSTRGKPIEGISSIRPYPH